MSPAAFACVSVGVAIAAATGGTAEASVNASPAKATCAATVNAAVATAEKPQKIVYPGAINMSKLKGKTVYFIPETLSNPVDVGVADGFKAAAKAAGVKAVVYPADATTSSFNSALAQAIGAHPAGILMYAIGPSYVTEELKKAKAAGIPVVAGGEPASSLVQGYTNFDYVTTGKQEADYGLKAEGCSGDIGIITANEFQNIENEAGAAQKQVKALCSSCKATITNIDITTMATQLGSETKNLILKDPNLKFLIAGFDAAAQYMVPAVQQAGSKVTVVGNTAVPANLEYVKKGEVQTGDFAFLPNAVEGWQELDQLARIVLKKPAATAWEKVPAQLITKSNYASASKFPAWSKYQSKFERIWGVG
jgi:ribose transport system substrate-binding protein